MDDYTRYAHSVCKLTYHAVLVTKYRRPVIHPDIMTFMQEYAKYLIEEKYGGKLIQMNGEPDHVHILFELPPTKTLATAVANLKTQLSKQVRAEFGGRISEYPWKDSFWSDSYFLTTTGGANLEVLERYITEQGSPRPKRKYARRKPRAR